jgi:phosphohistidine phosphatase
MRRICKSLKESGLKAKQIVTSPLRRARETAEIVAQTLKIPLLEEWDELMPDGDRDSLYRKLARIERGSGVVLVGHEPYLTSMIGELVGAPAARLILKKGGLAKVRITSFAPLVNGELRWLLTPKMMTRMS